VDTSNVVVAAAWAISFFSPTHSIALKGLPSRACNCGRDRGLLLRDRFGRGTGRQQRRRENQYAKPFNHDDLTSSANSHHLSFKGQGEGGVPPHRPDFDRDLSQALSPLLSLLFHLSGYLSRNRI
jgi:hypothetical protein